MNGHIGAIVRPDGSLQATYDGHPLYTTTTDTGPGQTKGDGVWSHGGEWHEVTVPDQGDDRRPSGIVEGGAAGSVRKSVPSTLSPVRTR